jgi:hypothetical protein
MKPDAVPADIYRTSTGLSPEQYRNMIIAVGNRSSAGDHRDFAYPSAVKPTGAVYNPKPGLADNNPAADQHP